MISTYAQYSCKNSLQQVRYNLGSWKPIGGTFFECLQAWWNIWGQLGFDLSTLSFCTHVNPIPIRWHSTYNQDCRKQTRSYVVEFLQRKAIIVSVLILKKTNCLCFITTKKKWILTNVENIWFLFRQCIKPITIQHAW